jgi:peptidoglycan hydrolase CwlO-like protein
MKKNSKNKTTMTAGEVAILVEDLKSQFRVFGEELKTLNSKVDGVATNQAETLERVTLLEITSRKIQADIAEIKTDFGKRLTHLEAVK